MQGAQLDGIHDLGGMEGFGPVVAERDEPLFHRDWEPRVRALSRSVMAAGITNAPMFRHAVERMDPAHYLRAPYYERWLTALTTLLVEQGQISEAELAASSPGAPLSRPLAPEVAEVVVAPGAETPRFAPGDAVRVRRERFSGHSRCPGYVRGRRGTVVRVDPLAPIAEVEAHRQERVYEHTYSVRFSLTELWGRGEGLLHVDLYEHHLDPLDG